MKQMKIKTMNMEHEFKEKMATLEQMLTKERLEFLEEKEEFKRRLSESNAKFARAENQMEAVVKRFENNNVRNER